MTARRSRSPATRGKAPAQGRRGPPSRHRISKTALLVTAATVVGMFAGLATIFDWFEGRVNDPPAEAIDARIESARLEPTRQRLGDYLHEQQLPTRGRSKQELEETGLIFLLSVRLQGNLGERKFLRFRLYRQNGQPVPGQPYDQLIGDYTPANQDHARRNAFWLPYPPRRGTYFARFTLLDEDRRPVDDLDTRIFRIKRDPG
jgi:hypothetical protein